MFRRRSTPGRRAGRRPAARPPIRPTQPTTRPLQAKCATLSCGPPRAQPDALAAANAASRIGGVNDAVPAAPIAAPAPREELFNALTHGAGTGLAIVGGVVLLSAASRHGSLWELTACAVYAVTLLGAYAASTLSHLFANPAARAFFRVTDQAMIFLFIAGTWTPVAVAWLHGPAWWAYHAVVWGIAVIGFVSKAMFAHRTTLGTVSTILYLVLGWTPVF